MSSRYQVLDNRPIDQWKVTELKEELKRRKLTIKGLKEDLVKRLDEALRIERENDEKANDLGSNSESEDMVKDEKAVPDVLDATNKLLDESVDENKKIDNIPDPIDINDSKAPSGGPLDSQAGVILDGNDSSRVEEEFVSEVSNVETTVVVTETVASEVALSEHGVQNIETEGKDKDLQSQLMDEETMPPMENEDLKHGLESNALNSPREDVMTDSFSPNNQVFEALVTSDSITTDTVTINETIELKDNVSAENLKLELDVEPEMVEPSITVDAAGKKSHLVDVEEQHENTAFVGEKEDSCGTEAGLSKKIEVADGYSEKLNLDRSSGDDSMEEDALESKQVESKCNPDEVEDMSEKSEVTIIKQETHESVIRKETYDVVMGDKKDPNVEKTDHSSLLAEKRKHPDHAAGVNEHGKRQRTWNAENIKIPEPKGSSITPSTTPKDASLSIDVKQFHRSDSTVNEGAAKERVVPPSPKPPSNSLRIVNFLRPFTLKAVQELLGKTGTVTSFWMDHIKTHCYVTFSSVEEAVETRNAVYNLQWPPNGGRLLAAEFVDPQEVKKRAEVPQPPTPTTTSASVAPPAPPTLPTHPSPRLPRQQLPPPPSLPPPPPLTKAPQVKERLPLPPPPAIEDKTEPPIVTLDDIFRKTKATPRIYYLPLSENQVAAKLAAEGKGTQI